MDQTKVARDAKSNDFVIRNIQKMVFCYHLPCSVKIFINVIAFLCVKANSKEICEEKC